MRLTILRIFLSYWYLRLFYWLTPIPKVRNWWKRNRQWIYNTLACKKREALYRLIINSIEAWLIQNLFRIQVPDTITIELTTECNQRCKDCYIPPHSLKKVEFSLLQRVIQQANSLLIKNFSLTGGEPFLESEMILHILETYPECFFTVVSNGTLIDDSMAARLSKHSNILIYLSLEGDIGTGKNRGNTQGDVLKAASHLNRYQVLLGASIRIYESNFYEVVSDQYIEFLMNQGFFAFLLYPLLPLPFGTSSLPALSPEHRWQFYRWLKSARKKYWACWSCPSENHEKGCAAGYKVIHISADGRIFPCAHIPYSTMNIQEHSLKQAMDSSFFQSVRKLSQETTHPFMKCLVLDQPEDMWKIIEKQNGIQPKPEFPSCADAEAWVQYLINHPM